MSLKVIITGAGSVLPSVVSYYTRYSVRICDRFS